MHRILVAALFCLFIVACATTSPIYVAPEDLGPFTCVPSEAIAAPPPRDPLTLGEVRDGKQLIRRRARPVLTIRLCPVGQVPVGKPTLSNVPKGNPLFGSMRMSADEFLSNPAIGREIEKHLLPLQKVYYIPPGPDEKKHVPPPERPACNGLFDFDTCFYYGPAMQSRLSDGGGMNMTIERPSFSGRGHSLDEIAVQGGATNGDIIELGWNLSPTTQYTDANPHLFVYHWIDFSRTCYDGCGWVQYSRTYFPGMNLSPLIGRTVYIGYVFFEGNWWAWFDNQWLGYFPGSIWSGKYTRSTLIQWFGEVATDNGIPPKVDMGNGRIPLDAAAAKTSTLCDVDAAAWVCWYRDMQSLGPNYPPYYDIRRTGFGETRYGGDGH